MATATRTVQTAARNLGAESNVARKATPVCRRRRKLKTAKVTRSIVCITIGVLSLGYIGLYAQVTTYGYRSNKLSREIRQSKMENQALKAEIQALSSPDRLAAVAVSAGMEPGVQVDYVSHPSVRVAKVN